MDVYGCVLGLRGQRVLMVQNVVGLFYLSFFRMNPPWPSGLLRGLEPGVPVPIPSRSGHCDVPFSKAQFLAKYWFVYPVIINK